MEELLYELFLADEESSISLNLFILLAEEFEAISD